MVQKNETGAHEKILFKLVKDSEGYPPDDWETVWGLEVENSLYKIENIPFYVRGISFGDLVSVDRIGNELFFNELIELSGHSVIRVIVFDSSQTDELTRRMSQMSCDYEGSHIDGFLAFDCPPVANYSEIVQYLEEGENRGKWEYEAASIRHE